ncbi:MAG: hypothetical protein ACPG4W_06670, partial [Flavobacteriales bacterium]
MNRLHLLIGFLSLTLFAYAQERNHLPSNSINQYIEQDKVISIDTVVSINLKIVEPDQNSSTYKVVKCISKDYVYDTTYINYVWDLNTTNINHLKSSLANDSENTPAWTEDIW